MSRWFEASMTCGGPRNLQVHRKPAGPGWNSSGAETGCP